MGLLMFGVLFSICLGFQIWRVRCFMKTTGFSFLKAWFVLGI